MKLVKLTTGDAGNVSIWINPMTVQVVNQKIGAKYKAVVVAGGQAFPVWEEASHIVGLMNKQLNDLSEGEKQEQQDEGYRCEKCLADPRCRSKDGRHRLCARVMGEVTVEECEDIRRQGV